MIVAAVLFALGTVAWFIAVLNEPENGLHRTAYWLGLTDCGTCDTRPPRPHRHPHSTRRTCAIYLGIIEDCPE